MSVATSCEEKAIGKFDESLQQLCVDLKEKSASVVWGGLQVGCIAGGYFVRSIAACSGIQEAMRFVDR